MCGNKPKATSKDGMANEQQNRMIGELKHKC